MTTPQPPDGGWQQPAVQTGQGMPAGHGQNGQPCGHLAFPLGDGDPEVRQFSLGAAALRYARLGLPVFPLKPGTKRPATEHGFKDATTDEQKITSPEWWGGHRSYNVAVATGGGLMVIDLDRKFVADASAPYGMAEVDGRESLAAWLAENQISLPWCPSVTTPNLGTHLWLRTGGRAVQSRSWVLPGVDVRGDGGYVAVYPSGIRIRAAEADGRRPGPRDYCHGVYAWHGCPCQAPLAPPELLDALEKLPGGGGGGGGNGGGEWGSLPELPLTEVLLQHGAGHPHANNLARLAARLCAQGLAEEQAYAVWRQVADLTQDPADPFIRRDWKNNWGGAVRKGFAPVEMDDGVKAWLAALGQPQSGAAAGEAMPNGQEDRIPMLTNEERTLPEFGPKAVPARVNAIYVLRNGLQPADIARTLAWASRGRLMWDPKYGEWLAWTGTHWRTSDPGWEDQHIQARRLRDTAESLAGLVDMGADDSANVLIPDPDGDKSPEQVTAYKRGAVSDALGGLVKGLASRAKQRDILGQVSSHQGIMVRVDERHARHNVLNFANCTVALGADAWWEHNPDDLITHCLPHNYNPDATCPQFLDLAWKMTGPAEDHSTAHTELYEFVLDVLGYCLIYGNPAQLVFFLTGPTKTGKTTVVEIVAELLGELLAHKSKPVLVTVSRSGDTHDSVRYSIRGKRLVYVDETEAKMRIDVSALKDLSGASTVPVRPMRGSTEVPTPVTWAMVIPTNQMPSMVGGDASIAERLVQILCLGRTIPVEQRDPGLKAKIIAAEAEGILALLVARARRYYAPVRDPAGAVVSLHGLPQPEAVRAASAKYMAAQDTVGGFRADKCTAQPVPGQPYAWVARPELFAGYEEWCGGRAKGLGRNEFYEAMREQPGVGETKDTRGIDIFTGIRLAW